MHPSLRTKITALFAVAIVAVIAAFGAFVYVRIGADLLDTVDAGLRSRADIIVGDVWAGIPTAADTHARLIESDESFAQVLAPDGDVLESSPLVARTPLVPHGVISETTAPRIVQQTVPGIDDVARILVVPVQTDAGARYVAVGTSLQDRRDEMLQLAAILTAAGIVTAAVISLAGWFLVGAALRPVERMRSEAAAVSVSEPGRRLHVPPGEDELSRLAGTFNDVLDRLQVGADRQRRLVDDASHELRTPLTVLKAELELALTRSRSPEELETALRRASVEADRLARLASDLLTLSRAEDGRVPIHREDIELGAVLEGSRDAFTPSADARDVRLEVDAQEMRVHLDPNRLRQALDNLLDNALRMAPPGSCVGIRARREDAQVIMSVTDAGPGFPVSLLTTAFDPFSRGGSTTTDDGGAGLGLAIVRAVVLGHGGDATVENLPGGGARVELRFPA
jgi:two-component system, OmpR family, sensor kinase